MERRPFERISKRILGSNLLNPGSKLPTPPPEDDTTQDGEEGSEKELQERAKLRDEIQLDFTTFEASIIRAQFLLNSNVQERERYAEEKIRIQAAAQDVGEDIIRLRIQLDEAKKQLALRKTYDQLAEQITSNKMLKPRAEQHANIEKLNNEIAELEQESRDYAQTWAERRQQFSRILGEAMELRRMIRDEKEEVERKEGMEGRDEDENDAASAQGHASAVGTPRAELGGATPMRITDDDGNLVVGQIRDPSRLRLSSPGPEVSTSQPKDDRDVTMAEDGEVSGDESDGLAVDDKEADSRSRISENMDTS